MRQIVAMENREILEKKIADLEAEMLSAKKQLQAWRKQLLPAKAKKYHFTNWNNELESLCDLFGDRDELLLVSNMGRSCVY